MGIRLEGPALEAGGDPSRLSSPVAPGAVQLAGADLIILGVACGTVGGYPHVAHVIEADLDQLAQLRPGQSFRFEPIDLEAARRLDRLARLERRSWCLRLRSASSG